GEVSAVLLAQRGYSVALCEAEARLGGRCHTDQVRGFSLPFGFAYNLLTEEQAGLLTSSSERGAQWIYFSDIPPISYEHKGWIEIPKERLTTEQKSFFVRHYAFPKDGVQNLIQAYLKHPKIEIHLSEPVLECFIGGGGGREREHVIELVGKSGRFRARAILMALPFSSLSRLLGAQIKQAWARKLKQYRMISCLRLDFVLKSKVSDFKNLIFNLENNGVGLFTSNLDDSFALNSEQISQWLYFLDENEVHDKEEIAKKMRAAKRFIKKAFPDFFDKTTWERIGIMVDFLPQKVEPFQTQEWTNLKNVFWARGGLSAADGRHQWFDELLKEVGKTEEYLNSFSRKEDENISNPRLQHKTPG
ncbi:MAG: FAD-dependent oxidoreductase, partial [Deltaproteobacteria bacterium]